MFTVKLVGSVSTIGDLDSFRKLRNLLVGVKRGGRGGERSEI